MFKITRKISLILIFVMTISSISTFNFTVFAAEGFSAPISVVNGTPYTYTLTSPLTKGKHKISTEFVYENALQGIRVQDSDGNTICGLKINPTSGKRLSVDIGDENWVVHKSSFGVSGVTGVLTLDMILDIDNSTVEYTITGNDGIKFAEDKLFYGYFRFETDKILTTKCPIVIGKKIEVSKVNFYRHQTGTFTVNSLDITDASSLTKTAKETTVSYADGAWTGATNTASQLGLDNSYSYGVYYGSIPTGFQYTVKNESDGISITSTSEGRFEKGSYVGITKSIDTTNMTGNELVIKTGFYNDGSTTGHGSGIRLKNSADTTPSFSMWVGKTGTGTGCGLDMRADKNVKNGDFGSSGVVLDRSSTSASALETNTWYDLTITVDKSKETDNITAKLEWDVPSNYTDGNYSASFNKATGLTVSGGRAILTNTYTTDWTDINAIELLQGAPGASYVGNTSKFKPVWTNAGVSADSNWKVDSTGGLGSTGNRNVKITSDEPVEATLLCACYDENKNFKGIKIERNVIVGTTNFGGTFSGSISPDDGDVVKAFLFDTNLRPLIKTPASNASEAQPEVEVIVPDGGEYMPSIEDIEVALEEQSGIHPRITLDAENIEKAKKTLADPDCAFITDAIRKTWENDLARELYVYVATDESAQKIVGDTMQSLAMAYKLTGEKKYYDRCLKWIDVAINMPQYGTTGKGISAAHNLSGLARTYDYLYYELSNDIKNRMKNTMLEKGAILWERAQNEDMYNENIACLIISAMADLALCLFDEPGYEDAAMDWLINSQKFIACSLQVMSPDGCSPEGTGYYGYGFNYVARFCEVAEKWGFNPFKCEGFVNSLKQYRMYISFPRNSWTATKNTVSIGDAEGFDYQSLVWMMYWYESKGYGNGALNWLANELRKSGAGRNSDVRELLYYDKNSPVRNPEEAGYPTMGDLRDYGYVFTRADWSGSGSAIYFQCGFNNGEHAIPYLRAFPEDPDFGHGHNDPSANDFVLYYNGDMLFKDDNYSWKKTGHHNTLLVDGKGQLGENAQWYLEKNNQTDFDINGPMPHVRKAESYKEYDYFVGSAEAAYYKSQEVQKFDRHMLYIKPNILVVIDDIKTKSPKDLELRFITGLGEAFEAGNGFIANGSKATMYVENLTPDEMELTLGKEEVWINQERRGLRGDRAFTAEAHKDAVTNVTLFSWCDKGGVPAKVEMRQDGDNYYFTTGGMEYTVNITNLNSSVKQVQQDVSGEEAKLEILTVQGINIPLKDGVYDYEFNLDDYYINARNSDMNITAIDLQFNKENVEVVMPEKIPGTANIYVKNGSKTNTYTVNLSKTTPGDITRVTMKPIDDTNAYSKQYIPSKLLDGSLTSCFRTGTRANHPIFDMGEIKKVCGFDIAWRDTADNGFNITILASKDGENFEEIYCGPADTTIETTVYKAFDKEYEARYIELIPEIGDNSHNYSYCLSEFAIYEH